MLVQAQMDKLMMDSNDLQEVIDIQIEEGFKRHYNITTLEEILKMEKVDKDKLLNRLNKLSVELFTLMH